MKLDGSGEQMTFFIKHSITAGDFGMRFSMAVSSEFEALAFIKQSFDEPPEVWAGKSGEWKPITHRNDGLHASLGKIREPALDHGRRQGAGLADVCKRFRSGKKDLRW